jgi:O-antigen ligase
LITGFYAVPILATLSRTALGAFILIFIFYIFLAESKRIYQLFTISIALILVSTVIIKLANNDLLTAISERVNEGDNARTDFLASSLKVVGNNFFTGVGLANFGDNEWRIANGFFMRVEGQIVQTASHNGLLDIIMIGGIFFFLAILYLLLYPTIKIYQRKSLMNKTDFFVDRFLTISVFMIFIVINLTYSSYMSKTAWTAIALLYIFTNKYSLTTKAGSELEIYEKV